MFTKEDGSHDIEVGLRIESTARSPLLLLLPPRLLAPSKDSSLTCTFASLLLSLASFSHSDGKDTRPTLLVEHKAGTASLLSPLLTEVGVRKVDAAWLAVIGRPGDTYRPPRRETNPRLLLLLVVLVVLAVAGDSVASLLSLLLVMVALPSSAPNRTCLLPPMIPVVAAAADETVFLWATPASVGVTEFAVAVVVDAAVVV